MTQESFGRSSFLEQKNVGRERLLVLENRRLTFRDLENIITF